MRSCRIYAVILALIFLFCSCALSSDNGGADYIGPIIDSTYECDTDNDEESDTLHETGGHDDSESDTETERANQTESETDAETEAETETQQMNETELETETETESDTETESTASDDTMQESDVIDTSMDASDLVWIPTKSGKQYHSNPSCSNMSNPKEVTLDEAVKLGFTACKKCYKQ